MGVRNKLDGLWKYTDNIDVTTIIDPVVIRGGGISVRVTWEGKLQC